MENTKTDWSKLAAEHELAYHHGALAVNAPQDYTLAELKAISDDMAISTAAIEEAMREDFWAMPPAEQSALLEMLCKPSVEEKRFWERVLLGVDLPLSYKPVYL